MTRPRLFFLHPKSLIDSWPFSVDMLGEVVKAPALVYPLLGATVKDLPVDIEMLDGQVAPVSFRDYKLRLARADIVAITVTSPLKALNTELTLRLLRRLNPKATVILGGNHASAFPERWIAAGADYVIVRDGEVAFRALIERLLAGERDVSDVPNLVYAGADREPVRTAGRVVTTDLDLAPIPLWEKFDSTPFRDGIGFDSPTASLEASRGCPHRCDFCNINGYWGYKQVYKSLDRVVEELDHLHRLGVGQFIFTDDNFGQDHKHTVALMERMIARNYGFRFACFLRGSTVKLHPEFVALAHRAGLRMVLMGIETLDEGWLSAHQKGVRTDDALAYYSEVYGTLNRAGVTVLGLFINPTQGDEFVSAGRGVDGVVCDFHYTADLLAQRGSALYERLLAEQSVTKDMFYHDWNLPSFMTEGSVQVNRKGIQNYIANLEQVHFAQLLRGSPMTRRLWRRSLGVLLERVFTSHRADVERYRICKSNELPAQERQDAVVASILNDRFVDHLVRASWWRGPLSLRTGL